MAFNAEGLLSKSGELMVNPIGVVIVHKQALRLHLQIRTMLIIKRWSFTRTHRRCENLTVTSGQRGFAAISAEHEPNLLKKYEELQGCVECP